MRKQNIKTLINKKLEKEITADEDQLLQKMLEKDPEVKKVFEELKSVDASLRTDATGQSEVDVTDKVMDRIDFMRYPVKEKPSILREFLKNLTLYPEYRVGIAGSLVFGVVIGIIAISIVTRNVDTVKQNPKDSWGTLMDNKSSGVMLNAGNLVFNNGIVKVTCEASYSAQNAMIQVELNSTDFIKANFQFSPDNCELYGTRFLDRKGEVFTQTGYDFFQINSKGNNKLLVLFKSKNQLSDVVHVRIFQDEALVYENVLPIRN